MEQQVIYIRMRNRINVKPNQTITIEHLAQVIGEHKLCDELRKLIVYQVSLQDKNLVVIDVMKVLKKIHDSKASIDVQVIGPSQTIVQITYEKKKLTTVYLVLVWCLLFIGAALAIMNFHEDVSMQKVHQKLYTLVTGQRNEYPLLLQVPYSIGLGTGMVLFFNHLFKKRFNEEPSPLEVEMFNYQQDLDQYVIINENKESEKKIHGD